MAGFDAQAFGGTHAHSTAEIGPSRLVKVDNKVKDNKRFYRARVEAIRSWRTRSACSSSQCVDRR